MKKRLIAALVLGATLAASAGVTAQADTKVIKPTIFQGAMPKKAKAIKQSVVTVPKSTEEKRGLLTLQFTIPSDGYVIPCVVRTGIGKITAEPLLQTKSTLEKTKAMAETFSVTTSAAHSPDTKISYMLYKKPECTKSSAVWKKERNEGWTNTGKYLKQGTYYLRIRNRYMSEKKVRVGLAYIPKKGTVILKKNQLRIGANSGDGKSLYKIHLRKKGVLKLMSYCDSGHCTVKLLNGKKKEIASGLPRYGTLLLYPGKAKLEIATNAAANPYLEKKLDKGTYYIELEGLGVHYVHYVLK